VFAENKNTKALKRAVILYLRPMYEYQAASF
jgi:hypothetical protein